MNDEVQQVATIVEHALDVVVHIMIQVLVYAVGLVAQAIQNYKP